MNRVMHWNAVALECVRRDHSSGYRNAHQSGPTRSSRALALVHLAIHDAVALIAQPSAAYLPRAAGLGLPPPPLTSWPASPTPPPTGAARAQAIDEAVDGAASAMLRSLYPGQADLIVEAVHSPLVGSPGLPTPSWTLGFDVAQSYAEWRLCDGAHAAHAVASACPPASVPVVTEPQPPHPFGPPVTGHLPVPPSYGDHRVDPFDLKQGLLDPGWGEVVRFTAAAHVPLAPYPGHASRPSGAGMMSDPSHRAAFVEVRDVGALRSTTRSVDQTVAGVFWGYDGTQQIGTPPRLYNQIVRQHVMSLGVPLSVESTAALFAVVNVAMADAGVDAWHHKYKYDLWRPVVGVRREKDVDADPMWAPYGLPMTNRPGVVSRTPPFPAYPSGHATFGAALFQVMRLLFNGTAGPITIADVLAFDDTATWPAPSGVESMQLRSDEFDGAAIDADGSVRTPLSRGFRNFAHAVHENAVSRVYLGVHWRFDGLPDRGATGSAADIGGVPLGLAIGEAAAKLLAGAGGPTMWALPPPPPPPPSPPPPPPVGSGAGVGSAPAPSSSPISRRAATDGAPRRTVLGRGGQG